MAEILAKEANKLATSFASSFPKFTVSTESAASATSGSAPSSASTALLEISKLHLKLVSDKLAVAVRDNDMIYHDAVPPVEALEPLEKLNAVKAVPFAELLPNGQADIPKIVGPDIFIKLIPMAVHQASSMYSEEKAQLLRKEQARSKSTDDEIDATLASLGLLKTLDRIKLLIRDPSQMGEEYVLPQEIMQWSVNIQNDESKTSKYKTDDLAALINSLKPVIQEKLSEVSALLEKEQHDCENMRV